MDSEGHPALPLLPSVLSEPSLCVFKHRNSKEQMGREERRVRLQKLLTSCFSDSFCDLVGICGPTMQAAVGFDSRLILQMCSFF